MPGPIPSASSRSSSYEDILTAGGSANLYEVVPVKPPPPPTEHEEVERISHRKHEAIELGVHGAMEAISIGNLLLHPKNALVRTVAPWLGSLSTAAFLTEAAIGPNKLDPARQAEVRRSYELTTAQLASGVLPKSYLQAKVEPQLAATAPVFAGMTRTLERKLGSPEKAEAAMRQFQAEAERGATAGMKYGASHELRSPAERDTLLAKDRSFRERYNGDLTFRAGVDAMVWLGANQPAEFEQRRASLSGQAARVAGSR